MKKKIITTNNDIPINSNLTEKKTKLNSKK